MQPFVLRWAAIHEAELEERFMGRLNTWIKNRDGRQGTGEKRMQYEKRQCLADEMAAPQHRLWRRAALVAISRTSPAKLPMELWCNSVEAVSAVTVPGLGIVKPKAGAPTFLRFSAIG